MRNSNKNNNGNRYKFLFKNIGLLTVSSFASKLLTFFLVPLYTSVLTTSEYGLYDLFVTTIGLMVPVLTLNIQESVLRFTLDDSGDESKKEILTQGIQLLLKSGLIVLALLFVNRRLGLLSVLDEYNVFFLMLYFGTALYQMLSNFSRGMEMVKEVAVAGVIATFTGLLFNIVLLLYIKIELKGYFIASIISSVIPAVYLAIKTKAWQYFSFKTVDSGVARQMNAYSIPLVFNSIGWWINNASDRYIVTWFCGIAINGVYSVGYKIPSILNVFQAIFNQAWVLSSVKAYDPNDEEGFFAKTYSLYNGMLVIICAILIIFTKQIAKILYAKEFYNAWIYVPFLLISIIFGAMSGLIGGVYSATKDSKMFGVSTMIGAVVNLCLNIVLVRAIGAIGAAIATAVSYAVVWLIRLINVRKYLKLRINIPRDLIGYICLVLLSILLLITEGESFYCMALAIFIVLLVLYGKEFGEIYRRIGHRI